MMMSKFTRPLAQNSQFRFFSTCSPKMLINGIDVKLNMSFNLNECKEYLKTIIQSDIKNIRQFDLLIYLPGGIPFTSGTLEDVFSTYSDPKVKQCIYGIITRPISDDDLDKIYTNLCDICSPQRKLLFSPICDSTYDGLCNISCLLSYFNYNGELGDIFQKVSSSIIPFPPFSTSLMRLIENDAVTGRDIITITSTLHTYFSHLINMPNSPETIFDYTLKICNYIMNFKEHVSYEFLIQNINFHQTNLKPNFWPLTVLKKTQYDKVIYMTKKIIFIGCTKLISIELRIQTTAFQLLNQEVVRLSEERIIVIYFFQKVI